MTVKACVVGATGYAGAELVRLLAQHPQVELTAITSHSYVGQPLEQVYPNFAKRIPLICEGEAIEPLVEQADILFFALPHGHVAQKIDADLLTRTRVVDLGADFRLQSADVYEHWYGLAHPKPELLAQAIYGLPEWCRERIKKARLIANPGCYPTCSALAIAPLLQKGWIDPNSIIIDAKSGVTGAGRALALGHHFSECNESIKAYGVASHRHTPEIEQTLGNIANMPVTLNFTPHLVPMNRGILATIYANLTDSVTEQEVRQAYEAAYHAEPFVRLLPPGMLPETRWVKGSNYCDIAFRLDERTRRIIVVAAIDNLVKGAAGQAIQNMNLMLDLEETAGLEAIPLFPV